jgi:hypothetical protein
MSALVRLKVAEVAATRKRLLAAQGGKCALCQQPCTEAAACLDHCHSTGAIRAVLHRSCNAVLGKVENGCVRYAVKDRVAFCSGLAPYLRRHAINTTGLLHPSHKSPEEKREARNRKARISRAKAKTTKAHTDGDEQ